MTFIPANSGVVIRPTGAEPSTTNTPDDALRSGYVVAVGGGVPWLREGDRVVYRTENAYYLPEVSEVCHPCSTALVVHQRDIVGVLSGARRDSTTGCRTNAA